MENVYLKFGNVVSIHIKFLFGVNFYLFFINCFSIYNSLLLTVREVSRLNPGNLPLLQMWHVGNMTGRHAVYMLIQCTPLLVEKAGVAPDVTFRITACKQERVQARYPLWIWNPWGRTHKVQNRSNQWLHEMDLGPEKNLKKKTKKKYNSLNDQAYPFLHASACTSVYLYVQPFSFPFSFLLNHSKILWLQTKQLLVSSSTWPSVNVQGCIWRPWWTSLLVMVLQTKYLLPRIDTKLSLFKPFLSGEQ